MFAHLQPMTVPDHIVASGGSKGDVASPSVSASAASDHHHHIRYDAQTLEDGTAIDDVATDATYVSDTGGAELVCASVDCGNQLTLSFRGQVFVFDAISSEKVPCLFFLFLVFFILLWGFNEMHCFPAEEL